MKRLVQIALALLLVVLAAPAGPLFAQGASKRETRNAKLERVSPAATALFVNSNLDSARTLAAARLSKQPADRDSLFVGMEAAALEADTAGTLDAAMRLCETANSANDPRVTIAAARILDLAGNTRPFRAAVPRIQRLVAADVPHASFLRSALIAAAADGLPGLSPVTLARQSGLITDWRVAGPFGTYANLAFDRHFSPERDALASPAYDGHVVERFRFDDGSFVLPDYFPTAGVFYAAADVNIVTAGQYRLRAETDGTIEIWIDGVSSLRKDDRFRATPEIAWSTVRLSAGTHRILVKFMPSAAPFRLALLPAAKANSTSQGPVITSPEAEYVKAAESYWLGDYNRAIELLTAARRTQPSAAVDFLLAQAWSHAAQDSPEESQLLPSALQAAPLAMAAEYELAARAFNADRIDEAYTRAQHVATARPDFGEAQALLAQAALRRHWTEEAQQALDAQLALHPSCSVLHKAAKFYSSISAYGRAEQIEAQLDGCAPGSLAYAESLSDAGRHADSAAAAAKLAAERPLDRDVRALLVRELLLAGRAAEAQRAASELVQLAPNSAAYRQLAEKAASGALAFDHPAARAVGFADGREFYTAYRRSAIEYIQKTANRRFAGGPAVTILRDRVAQLGGNGSISLYVHEVTRVLNRDGIERYGEVALPRSADLLELRTLKADGTIAEPEFNQHKNTVSMPALAPGDAIEVEYVLRYAEGGIAEHADAFTYTFGSFTAPILYARFAVLSPAKGETLMLTASAGVPSPALTTADGWNARVWEQENIAQSVEEVSAPHADVLPTVRIVPDESGWRGLRDFYRNQLIDAVRIGMRVESTAQQLRGRAAEETARNIYRAVTTRLHSSGNGFATGELVPAENTLADYSGSRTAALLALARAAGLDAELLLARDIGHPRPLVPLRDVYTHPLVLFRFEGKQVVTDAESDGVAFGVLPPTVAHEDALAIPLTETAAQHRAAVVPVPPSAGDEHSLADADVTIDPQGNLTARVHIRMGAARSAQMRSILSGVAPAGRKHFFEQTATRIFPGATDATGEVRHESDSERPLELDIACRAPHFLNLAGNGTDMEQLAPALGLRKMYGLGPRRAPLYIDTALVETAVFHVHLPAGVRVNGVVPDLRVDNEFGSYELSVRLGNNEVELRRAFRIPVQVIPPENFQAFAHFARLVDDAERQRLGLARVPAAATVATGK